MTAAEQERRLDERITRLEELVALAVDRMEVLERRHENAQNLLAVAARTLDGEHDDEVWTATSDPA